MKKSVHSCLAKTTEENRSEGDKDKGETLIDWPHVQVESRSCSTINNSDMQFFQQKQSIL